MLTMPQLYHCTACSIRHTRPVGRRCQRDNLYQQATRRARNPPAQGDGQPGQVDPPPEMMQVMRDIRGAMQDLSARMDRVELAQLPPPLIENNMAAPIVAQQNNQNDRGQDLPQPEIVPPIQRQLPQVPLQQPPVLPPQQQQGAGAQLVNPQNIRDDDDLVARAHAALNAIVNVAEGRTTSITSQANRGKKSGSTRTSDDVTKHDIPWPHFAIRRAADKKAATYESLDIDDFVYGFLSMLEKPDSGLDPAIMLPILRNLMQDSRDFSWKKARDFYRDLAAEVEKGNLKWSDTEAIHLMRMTACRTLKPADLVSLPVALPHASNRQSAGADGSAHTASVSGPANNVLAPPPARVSAAAKQTSRPAPPGTQCCVPFQSRACEHSADHGDLMHACAYCTRTKQLLCRHPEVACIRKFSDSTKNGQQRE